MENKEYPELQPEAADQLPIVPAAEETPFVDFFADILPDQPVSEESVPELTEAPAEAASLPGRL